MMGMGGVTPQINGMRRKGSALVTLEDVAKRAGVSMMTVSRVINKSANVSEKTRERVQKAIEELSYHPNMVARGLATDRSRMIAYVMTNLANPFFSDVSMGIENICVKHGYSMVISDVSSEDRLSKCINMLIERRLDGVVFHHLKVTAEQVAQLQQNNVQCVTIDNEYIIDDVSMVDSDNYEGARMAVQHLISRGHKKIGCIHGHFDSDTQPGWPNLEYAETFQRRIWQDRTRGFLDEMHKNGLEPVIMVEGRGSALNSMLAGGYSMHEILNHKNGITALYCENDLMALGALGECLENNKRTPQDIAIIGHDGLNYSMELYPRITTIRQPKYRMGYIAAEQLIRHIEQTVDAERMQTHSVLFQGDTT